MSYDVVIVGAGLSGATIAHLYAPTHKVLVIDKRDHIGGNVYDTIDSETNIRISKYGAHLFHTNDSEVWNFVQQFGPWQRWDHEVKADISGILVPIPVNITTINTIFNESLITEDDMKNWLQNDCIPYTPPKNSEEVAISRVGTKLYNLLFKEYTKKQWAKGAEELDASVLSRIPVKYSYDPRYFSDKYQALPINGYTSIVSNMLSHPNISIKLNTSWEDLSTQQIQYKTLIFTGPIDQYFKDKHLPPLEYRSIHFTWEKIKNSGYYQQNSVINYPSKNTKYTRCVEYKHFLNQKSDWTILAREETTNSGEPYYPVPTKENQQLYEQYVELANIEKAQKNVHFIGRLANYKYFNMDQAIRNAIDYYNMYLKVTSN
jgi:UDP-galactopyranose mutase